MKTQNEILDDYREGATKLYNQLSSWSINLSEAKKLERDARNMWHEDVEELGLSRAEAKLIWEDEVMWILRQDPGFDD